MRGHNEPGARGRRARPRRRVGNWRRRRPAAEALLGLRPRRLGERVCWQGANENRNSQASSNSHAIRSPCSPTVAGDATKSARLESSGRSGQSRPCRPSTAAGHAPWLWAHSSPLHWPVLAIAEATNTLTAALASGPVGPVTPESRWRWWARWRWLPDRRLRPPRPDGRERSRLSRSASPATCRGRRPPEYPR